MAQLNFKGKPFVQNHHLMVKYHELAPKKEKSLTNKVSLHDSLIIHGDNLKALKALLPTFAGKVKCIYIDPPYNTGNEKWAYNDNVNSPMMQEWLGKVVDREDLTRHDKWLCMMTPRLKLLRELLRDDGVIFVSIDDNEVHHLRMLMDEVFGEENFVATVIWQKKYSPQSDAKYFSDMHDFLLAYAKKRSNGDGIGGWERNLLPRTEEQDARYRNLDNDPRGSWKASGLDAKTYMSAYDYPITTPSGRVVNPPKGSSWRVSQKRFEELVKDNRIWFGSKGNNVPAIKRFLSEVQAGIVPVTIWFREQVGDNESAKREIKEIFPESDMPFQTPKPSSLIKRILQIASDENSFILDSFAGSGTTAHAVLSLNKEDGLPAPRPNTFYVYAIKCDDASLYIGQTEDLHKRWQEHMDGVAAEWTKRHKPLYIAHYEEYSTREEAVKREKELKTGFGRKWLKMEIEAGRARQAGGNRKFILVECEDYADKITAERVRRVIKGMPNAKDENNPLNPLLVKGGKGGFEGLGGSFSYFELGKPIEMESILSGKNLPTYKELARYVFYTATGEEFDEKAVKEPRHFIGESKEYEVYLFYKPDMDYLKNTALTLDRAKSLGAYRGKKRLVFAPTKYLDQEHLDELRIDFAQLPFEIYKLAE